MGRCPPAAGRVGRRPDRARRSTPGIGSGRPASASAAQRRRRTHPGSGTNGPYECVACGIPAICGRRGCAQLEHVVHDEVRPPPVDQRAARSRARGTAVARTGCATRPWRPAADPSRRTTRPIRTAGWPRPPLRRPPRAWNRSPARSVRGARSGGHVAPGGHHDLVAAADRGPGHAAASGAGDRRGPTAEQDPHGRTGARPAGRRYAGGPNHPIGAVDWSYDQTAETPGSPIDQMRAGSV